jgi:NAD+ synthase (glutamine-hydrolysing)
MMPSKFSSQGSLDDAEELAKNLKMETQELPIHDLYSSYLKALEKPFEGKEFDLTEENIQARIRGNLIMAFSNKFGYLVLSTGNKSELAVGYCTLYGDMSGGLSVLGDVPKTLVYKLCNFRNKKEVVIPKNILTKAPSAELRPNQTDQDSLPSYEVLDAIIKAYIEDELILDEIVNLGYDPVVVKKIIKLIDLNEYKRRQAAVTLRITSKAFGTGRRLPIAQRFTHEILQ